MEAFVLERYGSKVDLRRQDVAAPEVGPYDVLVLGDGKTAGRVAYETR